MIALAITTVAMAPTPVHTWRLIDGKAWQRMSPAVAQTVQPESEHCSVGMLLVTGMMKQDRGKHPWMSDSVEELQKTTCTKWINRNYPERCAEFDREAWLRLSRDLKTRTMNFCVDKYEYPNVAGQNPAVSVTWDNSQALCAKEEKRLCTEDEWTFACEGPEARPYPYGYSRDDKACNIDKQWIMFRPEQLSSNDTSKVTAELERLWQGEPSGSREGCVSVFGVHDMTGNIDEWTVSTQTGGNKTILKGGYWSRVRTRCRPSTRNHNEMHQFYQQGFRCCQDSR